LNDNEGETENRTRELKIPFIICTDQHAKVTWIAEGEEAIDPDPMGPACIPGSADDNQLAVEVMSNRMILGKNRNGMDGEMIRRGIIDAMHWLIMIYKYTPTSTSRYMV
jgi:hypothetical protein